MFSVKSLTKMIRSGTLSEEWHPLAFDLDGMLMGRRTRRDVRQRGRGYRWLSQTEHVSQTWRRHSWTGLKGYMQSESSQPDLDLMQWNLCQICHQTWRKSEPLGSITAQHPTFIQGSLVRLGWKGVCRIWQGVGDWKCVNKCLDMSHGYT